MRCQFFWKVLYPMLLILAHISVHAKKQKTSVITRIDDIKEFKKLLRTKTNVMLLFVNVPKQSQTVTEVFKETADVMKGQATLVIVDCSTSEGKKLCKKLKISSDKPYSIKHYKDGDFHKDYDRSESVSSMTNFLRDPTGDLPWEEDPVATDIYHLQDGDALAKFLRKGSAAYKKSLIMFYAPWCGYCKSMKPDYVQAAGDLRGEALLAAIDVAKPGNAKIRQLYNITGFPTLLYYEKGQMKFPYNGENKRQAIVDFMRDPTTQAQKKQPPVDESWSDNSDVVHLTAENFKSVLSAADHALVVFYAPWCGHCKSIKPEFEKAATRIKTEKINGILCAVDATKQPELASSYGVNGYPTLKYFHKGEYQYEATDARQEDDIISFIKDPREPPPPPPPEVKRPWAEEESAVRHLGAANFKTALRKVKHALVMFYAPWCGHCESTKPEFVKAATRFADELMVLFGAVDCTAEEKLCAEHSVRGYPTLKYFSHFDRRVQEYTGGRQEADFVSYIHSTMGSVNQQAAASPQAAGFGGSVRLAFDADFETIIASDKPVFVMFHAIWCDHCVASKPAFSKVATALKTENSPVTAIAVEADKNPKVADIAGIQTLPTFKMFAGGKVVADYTGDRSVDDMINFCKTHAKVKDEL